MRPILAVLALLLLPACGEDEPAPDVATPQPPGTIEIEGELANDRGLSTVSRDAPLVMTAGDFYFEPTIVTGPPGASVEVRLSARGEATHNFSLPEQGLDQDVEPGATATFQLTLPESGLARFFCSYHRDQRMVGALQV